MNEDLRKARAADAAPHIWPIILQAKAQMRRRNSRQWQDGYPALENIAADIAQGNGYVLSRENQIIAYAAVIFTGEPAYDPLDRWLNDTRSYVVVHRLAVADAVKHQGVATRFLQKIEDMSREQGVRSFRVDTNFDNLYMRKALIRLGFTYCGEVFYQCNRRMAYEKIIQ
jgi:GNAT superfamily N-acetyltransferase